MGVPYNGIEIAVNPLPNRCRYDAGLEALTTYGYTRYLRVREAFGIVIGVLEGRASPLVRMVRDSFQCYEWLSLAWEIRGGKLIAYIDPTGLKWQEPKGSSYKYRTPDFTYRERREFSIAHLMSNTQKRHHLKEFDDKFVRFHCGRPLKALPSELKRGDSAIRVDLPRPNFLVPVAHAFPAYVFGHVGCNGAVRGAKEHSA